MIWGYPYFRKPPTSVEFQDQAWVFEPLGVASGMRIIRHFPVRFPSAISTMKNSIPLGKPCLLWTWFILACLLWTNMFAMGFPLWFILACFLWTTTGPSASRLSEKVFGTTKPTYTNHLMRRCDWKSRGLEYQWANYLWSHGDYWVVHPTNRKWVSSP